MVSALREHLEREEYPKQVVVMVTSAYEFDVFAARIRKPEGALVGGPEDGPEEGATDSNGNGLATGIGTSREKGDSNGDGA